MDGQVIIFILLTFNNLIVIPWRTRKKLVTMEADRLAVCTTCDYPTNWVENISICPECGTRTQRIPLDPARWRVRSWPIILALTTTFTSAIAFLAIGHFVNSAFFDQRPWEVFFFGAAAGFAYFFLLCRGRPRFGELVAYRVVSRRKDQVDPAILIRRRHRADVEE